MSDFSECAKRVRNSVRTACEVCEPCLSCDVRNVRALFRERTFARTTALLSASAPGTSEESRRRTAGTQPTPGVASNCAETRREKLRGRRDYGCRGLRALIFPDPETDSNNPLRSAARLVCSGANSVRYPLKHPRVKKGLGFDSSLSQSSDVFLLTRDSS